MGDLILETFMPEEIITVLAVGVEVESLEAPLDAPLEHGLFFRAQVNARLRIYQLAEPRIIFSGNCFIVNTHRVNGAV
jgi:hypothetical protein